MRTHGLLLALALGLGLVAPAVGDTPAAKADPARIEQLVQQLGSPKFTERARAKQQLKAIGAPALEALRKATKSDDLEVSRAATELVNGLEAKQLTANLLAPKRVKLNLQDTPVLEAVAELSRQSGYSINVQGDTTQLANRKVTLQTGETTFWEAFDQLCQKAGLVEANQVNYAVPPRALPPVRLQQLPAPPGAPGILPVVPPAKPVPPQAFGAAAAPAAVPVVAQIQIQIGAPGAAPAQVKVPVQVAPAGQPGQGGQGGQGGAGAQPGQPGQPAAQPGKLIARPIARPLPNGQQLLLQPGTPRTLPTCYAGAVRIRALPVQTAQVPAGEVWVQLEVTPEPRLQGFNIPNNVSLDKAVDDQGQKLMISMETDQPAVAPAVRPAIARVRYPLYNANNRLLLVRLKAGEKQAKALKELSGSLTASVLAPTEPLIKVENVLKAAGQKTQGAAGGSIEVMSINKQDNGDYRVQIRMENPPAGNVGGAIINGGVIQIQQQVQIQILPGGQVQQITTTPLAGSGVPLLLDAKGQAYQLVAIPSRNFRGVNGVFTQELTMDFRTHNGQGEPASLVLNGQRSVSVSVPFRLENVPVR